MAEWVEQRDFVGVILHGRGRTRRKAQRRGVVLSAAVAGPTRRRPLVLRRLLRVRTAMAGVAASCKVEMREGGRNDEETARGCS